MIGVKLRNGPRLLFGDTETVQVIEDGLHTFKTQAKLLAIGWTIEVKFENRVSVEATIDRIKYLVG